ncbi:hypothetical protein D910_11855 [Dendroctonus ponderosae]|uniref:Uncharacterized protein n=1 Tax=Dendroctonus ponderosae TaxID=77166 RepID=U4UPZ5_DENPD|nr:hypothetical protein D910_11855 [Dendroctonus ponderosae]
MYDLTFLFINRRTELEVFLLRWLQDVDDKWEKIKEHMLVRHHNEADSLRAVQKMNWEWKLKELSLGDKKLTPKIDELHVPEVHVSDDFDLLPT